MFLYLAAAGPGAFSLQDADEAADRFFEKSEAANPVAASWEIMNAGRHRLLLGDSTQPQDVSRVIGGAKAVLWRLTRPIRSEAALDTSRRPTAWLGW